MKRLLISLLAGFALACGDGGSPETGDSCAPDCTARQCGGDGCGGTCGTCEAGLTCSATQQCVASCAPSCENAACGDDGCGGTCGTCEAGLTCSAAQQCEATCTPSCANAQCGDDGCGGTCGTCSANERCDAGTCTLVSPSEAAACTDNDSSYVPTGYRCVWNDEFGGELDAGQVRSFVDTTSWTFQNLNVNGEAQNYTNRECPDPAHFSDWNYCVRNGALTIRARDNSLDCSDGPDSDDQPDDPDCALDWAQARGATAYTSGRLITKHKVSYQYGYIEFRARLPHYNRQPQSGFWPAIWLLGSNINEGPPPGDTAWPWCGEFDIMEWRSPGNHMGWNALWVGADQNLDACSDFPEGGSSVCGPCVGGPCTGVVQNGSRWRWDGWFDFPHTTFHTYGFLWTADSMTVFIDGELMSIFDLGPNESEFQQEMFIIMNLALGGTLGGNIEITDWSTATLEVDYIRWYRSEND